ATGNEGVVLTGLTAGDPAAGGVTDSTSFPTVDTSTTSTNSKKFRTINFEQIIYLYTKFSYFVILYSTNVGVLQQELTAKGVKDPQAFEDAEEQHELLSAITKQLRNNFADIETAYEESKRFKKGHSQLQQGANNNASTSAGAEQHGQHASPFLYGELPSVMEVVFLGVITRYKEYLRHIFSHRKTWREVWDDGEFPLLSRACEVFDAMDAAQPHGVVPCGLGSYTASFFHDMGAALGLPPTVKRADVADAEVMWVR
ncbi:unnamed protein product, partial [Amoebophrya sp. A25]